LTFSGIDDVNIVINYRYLNQPENPSAASKKWCEHMYLNQIANIKQNMKGFAITFFVIGDHKSAEILINTLRKSNQVTYEIRRV
jgi:hypothetical protein